MRKFLTPIFCLSVLVSSASDPHGGKDRNEIRYIQDNKRVPNKMIQHQARHNYAWKSFLEQNGTWYVQFKEETMLPSIAYGKPIVVPGGNAEDRAMNFIENNLSGFNLPVDDLELTKVITGKHNTYVNFRQLYQGLEVVDSRVKVKLTQDGKVNQFKADVFDIDISIEPEVTWPAAIQAATNGMIGEIIDVHQIEELAILPIPVNGAMEYHLIRRLRIETMNEEGIPGDYLTYVDANSGEVLSRQNLVMHCGHAEHDESECTAPLPGGPSLTVNGTLHEENPYIPAVSNPLANIEIQQGANTFTADNNGTVSTGLNAGTATVRLSGLYSYVQTNGNTPEFDVTVNSGPTMVSFDNDATTQQLSAYYHVNIVHDYMKTKFPTFATMDTPLQTNVDVSGDCNAFYNGLSINFYLEGNDCTSFANVADVVYHEYGHGINDKYYQSVGGSFGNGALHEGYADLWAMGITNNPVVGLGTSLSDPNSFIRRYDINPKVYPIDIVGEVHADGEIIAGAWWDLAQIWGDLQQMMDLYSASFDATITGPNGDEGQVYVEVLVEALQLDDVPANGGDNDITNGTPNDLAIVEAFGIHGITLLSNAELDHDPIMAANEEDIDIDVDITLTYAWALEEARLFYGLNDGTVWTESELVNSGGSSYSATIPQQPSGTIIKYFLALVDVNGVLSAVQPIGSDLYPHPNIPNYILVGYETAAFEDFDNEWGDWVLGDPTDNATTGEWIIDEPTPSFSDNGVMVQTDMDVTEGNNGIACAITGNGSQGGGIGENDVDGGKTTLYTPVFDLTQYDDPAVTYYRYYTNSPPSGANPGADYWQVEITSDGTNWQYFENTLTSDMRWRRVAFRVADHVPVTSTFQMRFVASDSLRPGQELDGGSLIEAAVDELYIWQPGEGNSVGEFEGINSIDVYPNPTTTELSVGISNTQPVNMNLFVLDVMGRIVTQEESIPLSAGSSKITIDTRDYVPGPYQLVLRNNKSVFQKKFTVVR